MASLRTVLPILFTLMVIFPHSACAQDEPHKLKDSIVVTGTRTPSVFSELSRAVTVIGHREITEAPVSSVNDLLAHSLGVDIRQRGANGVQGDISIRGGTFQQTLILVDGVKVTDPQTGHHNADIPVTLSEIERVEILRGPGSRAYGQNAMAGVINLITAQPEGKRFNLATAVGDFGLVQQQVSASYPAGNTVHRLSYSRRYSNGHRDNTEFDMNSLSYRSGLHTGVGVVNLAASYEDKEFGAYKFYSDAFPDEWEATETLLASASADLSSGNVLFSPKVFWRRHEDDFVLDRNRPDWYRNRHTTDHYGSEFQITIPSTFGMTAIGGEIANEEIRSSNLGNHSRLRGSLFAEQRLSPVSGLSIVPGISACHYENRGWNVSPGIDVGYRVNERTRVFASIGKSYRVPTFTELYYRSPANMGNPDLVPEETWTWEAGAEWRRQYLNLNTSYFVREGDNLIDWARNNSEDPWQVLNVSETTTRGIEFGATFKPEVVWEDSPINTFTAQYTYLDTDHAQTDFESKYVLDHLSHQALFNLNHNWVSGLTQDWRMRYLKRFEGREYTVVDTRLTARHKRLTIFLEASNLFDQSYIEIGTIPMPGRWFSAGASLDLALD